ncbi:MAG TPA: response regulator, partial [Polyangiaceae bacterium]|nr:response regulator [Polyangiaceae bacterium]
MSVHVASPGTPRVPLRVLLVEDEPATAAKVASMLEQHGYELSLERVCAEDDYRAKLAEAAPEIILSDYSVPRFGALCALRLLRDLELDIPLIVLTGSVGEEQA